MEETKDLKKDAEVQKDLVPVAQDILRLIGNNDNVLGDLTIEDREKYYVQITDKIIDICKEKELTSFDVTLIFQLLLQAYDSVRTATFNSITRAEETVVKKFYGKEVRDISVKDIYDKLSS